MLSGRRRWLPQAASPVAEERSAADRVAVNTIMQARRTRRPEGRQRNRGAPRCPGLCPLVGCSSSPAGLEPDSSVLTHHHPHLTYTTTTTTTTHTHTHTHTSLHPALRAQGSAADVCKRAMVDIPRQLAALRPPRPAVLVLQVHDELLLEVEAGRLREVGPCGVLCTS